MTKGERASQLETTPQLGVGSYDRTFHFPTGVGRQIVRGETRLTTLDLTSTELSATSEAKANKGGNRTRSMKVDLDEAGRQWAQMALKVHQRVGTERGVCSTGSPSRQMHPEGSCAAKRSKELDRVEEQGRQNGHLTEELPLTLDQETKSSLHYIL